MLLLLFLFLKRKYQIKDSVPQEEPKGINLWFDTLFHPYTQDCTVCKVIKIKGVPNQNCGTHLIKVSATFKKNMYYTWKK